MLQLAQVLEAANVALRLRRVLAAGTTSYERVYVVAWDCLSAAGDAAATWSACTNGRSALACDPTWGWLGRVPLSDATVAGAKSRLQAIAARALEKPWAALARDDAEKMTGTLGFGVSTSKGDLGAWDAALSGIAGLAGNSAAFIDAWPGQLTQKLARQLVLPSYYPIHVAAACSTGLYALLDAADALEHQRIKQACIGAADASLTPWLMSGFKRMGVLCGQEKPQAFAQPTGFAPAEGAAFISLAHRGRWKLIAGVRLGDAGHETEFRDPQTLRQALCGLWQTAPGPDLIITHGTGTARGDEYEAHGLRSGPWVTAMRLACKPSIGHSLGASSLVELCAGLESSVQRVWKIGLGFGGHLAAVALERV
jgi:3-oxoacyl-(acyl-carrier-protein) synthase